MSGGSSNGGDWGGGGGGGSSGSGRGAGTMPATHLKITPRRVTADAVHIFHFSLTSGTASCRVATVIHFAGHKTYTSRKGKARIKARLPHPGRWTAVAGPKSCQASEATVRAR